MTRLVRFVRAAGGCLIMCAFAADAARPQLPNTFTEITREMHFEGTAMDVAVAPDGTVFMPYGTGGLLAYNYDTTGFTRVAHIENSSLDGEAVDVLVTADSTVFLANGADGLRVYTFTGSGFVPLAHRDDGGNAGALAMAADGTIFLANGQDGLRAYTFDGATLTNTAHFNPVGSTDGVAVGADGTIFLAQGDAGLWACRYDGSGLTGLMRINDGMYSAADVAVAADGTIILAQGIELRTYTFDGSAFTNTASAEEQTDGWWPWRLAVAPDSTIFVASRGSVVSISGVFAYRYEGTSLAEIDRLETGTTGIAIDAAGTIFHAGRSQLNASEFEDSTFGRLDGIDEGAWADLVAVGPDSTIFVSGGLDGKNGLYAYTFNGRNLANRAGISDFERATDLAVGSDGTVFLVNAVSGWGPSDPEDHRAYTRAYKYDGVSFVRTAHLDKGSEFVVVLNDSTIAISNLGLTAYRYDGQGFAELAKIDADGEHAAIEADGTLFLGNGSDGLRAYAFDGTAFSSIAQFAHAGSNARHVAVGSSRTIRLTGTVYLIDRDVVLRAYRWDGSELTNFDNVPSGGEVYDLAAGADGTVFISNRRDGLRAYSSAGGVLTHTARLGEQSSPTSIAVGADGALFAARGSDGLVAYAYTSVTTAVADAPITLPAEINLRQNYPNPFNPTTVIEFSLPAQTQVTLKVFDIKGKEVVAVLDGKIVGAGTHRQHFDARHLAAGIYLYRLQAGSFIETRKLMVLR